MLTPETLRQFASIVASLWALPAVGLAVVAVFGRRP